MPNLETEKHEFLDNLKSSATGISDLDFRAFRYMLRPFSLHTTEFHEYWTETKDMLKQLFHTNNDLIGMTGAIRVAFDAIVGNVIEPGDEFLVLTNGYWGSYVKRVVESYRGKCHVIEQKPGKAIEPDQVSNFLDEHKNIKAVSLMHVETDTGIWHPVSEIDRVVRKKSNALFIVDCATSYGGMEVNVDDWHADFCFSGSHKCMSSPVGLAFITVSERAWEAIKARKEPIMGTYNDLLPWKDPIEDECEPPLPATIIHAVRGRLEFISRHGETNVFMKHALCASAVRHGLAVLGLQPLSESLKSPPCSNVATVFQFPVQLPKESIAKIMTNRYKIAFGESPYRAGVFQIGTVNENECNVRSVLDYITCLGLTLSELGMSVDLKGAIETANNELKRLEALGF